VDNVYGTNFICLLDGYYSGAGYSFNSRKRTPQPAPLGKECQRPDLLELEDGKKYDLVDLVDAQFDELVEIVGNGTVQADVSKFFQEVNRNRCGNMHGCSKTDEIAKI
jgi:hypothetical protein